MLGLASASQQFSNDDVHISFKWRYIIHTNYNDNIYVRSSDNDDPVKKYGLSQKGTNKQRKTTKFSIGLKSRKKAPAILHVRFSVIQSCT